MNTGLNESALAAVLDAAPDAVYLIDPASSHIVYCNRAGHQDLGFERAELLNHSVLSLQKDVTGMPQWSDIADSIRQSSPYVFLGRHRHREGHEVSVEVHTTTVDVAGRSLFLSVARDISRREQLSSHMISREAHVQFALNEVSDGLWDWHIPSREVFFSPQLKRMLGYGPHEMAPTLDTWSSKLHPDHKPLVIKALQDHIEGLRERYEAEYRMKNRNGHYLWVRDRGRVCERDALGHATRVVGMVQNITDHKAQEAHLQSLAAHDGLTGLRNRRECEHMLLTLCNTCRRLNVPLGVCMLDIDHFKSINDTQGHLVGDQVLVKLSETLSRTIRASDGLFRWGGEEFLLLAPGLGAQAMLSWADKLREQIAQTDWSELLGTRGVTASLGVAVMPQNGEDPIMLVAAADSAMYQAKSRGRNQVCLADTGVEPCDPPSTVSAAEVLPLAV